jgi:hypothetical protein
LEKIVDIEINKANALITLGSMYRSAADAIKEYVSNALDEWAMARSEGRGEDQCQVTFTLDKKSITIDYNAPGMDEEGFERALKRVVDSAKRDSDIPQIGRLGIGLWAFNQVGTKATFLSKRSAQSPTLKVILSRESAEAQIVTPDKGEERAKPGMTIEITGLFQDPTRRYGPLSQARLKHVLADRFDVYLRTGQLAIAIKTSKGKSEVTPVQLDLPEIGKEFQEMLLPGSPCKLFRTRFWFDPSGQGRVAIRHTGVVIVEDARELFEHEMADSILISGLIKGFVDAEFLSPLPARAQFFEDEDLAKLLAALKDIGGELEKEIASFRDESEMERVQALFRRATRVAREIFSQEEFLDLELIDGLRRVNRANGETQEKNGESSKTPTANGHKTNGQITNDSNVNGRGRAARAIIRRSDFGGDVRHRSRLNDGAIEININNPDFLALSRVPRSHQVAYVAMLLGKEIIAYNDSSRASDEALEKMAAYGTRVLSNVLR